MSKWNLNLTHTTPGVGVFYEATRSTALHFDGHLYLPREEPSKPEKRLEWLRSGNYWAGNDNGAECGRIVAVEPFGRTFG